MSLNDSPFSTNNFVWNNNLFLKKQGTKMPDQLAPKMNILIFQGAQQFELSESDLTLLWPWKVKVTKTHKLNIVQCLTK